MPVRATGYTNYVVHGKGDRGVRPRHAEPPKSKIEVNATPDVAHPILEHIAKTHFDNCAMIAFLDDVEVIRGPKFLADCVTESRGIRRDLVSGCFWCFRTRWR